MKISILTALLSFSFSYSQCLVGDCDSGKGEFQNEILKKIGVFENGLLVNGKVFKVLFSKLEDGNYSKIELIKYNGIFENGNIKKGKSFDENGILKYDGDYIIKDNFLLNHGIGKLYYKNGKTKYDGIFENGNIKKGKSFDENGVLEYDGGYIIKDNYLLKHGIGKLYYKNGKTKYDGIFENGNIKKGKSFDENGVLEYDGGYIIKDNYLLKHGNAILYKNGLQYHVSYNFNELITNQFNPNDIQGSPSDFIEINLETRENGTNELIQISIHGLSAIKKYVFDTGSETFDISPSMEKYLLKNDLITQDDYLPPIITRDANNSQVILKRVRVSNVQIGEYIVDNVVVTINNSDDDPLLCGRSLLQLKFKNVEWSPGKLTLYRK